MLGVGRGGKEGEGAGESERGMWGGKEGVDTARWACGAGRPLDFTRRVG